LSSVALANLFVGEYFQKKESLDSRNKQLFKAIWKTKRRRKKKKNNLKKQLQLMKMIQLL